MHKFCQRKNAKLASFFLVILALTVIILAFYAIAKAEDLRASYLDTANETYQPVTLIVDTAGMPHVCYYDAISNSLNYAYRDEDGWHIEIIDDSGDICLPTSISLDVLEMPHVCFFNATRAKLGYAYRDLSGWNVETVDSIGDMFRATLGAAGSLHSSLFYFDFLSANANYLIKNILTISSTNPKNGTTGVKVGQNISIKFSGKIQVGEAFKNITLSDLKGRSVKKTYYVKGDTLIINPSRDLNFSEKYVVFIPKNAVEGLSGESLIAPYELKFTTQTAPKIKPPSKLKITSTAPQIVLYWSRPKGAKAFSIYRKEDKNPYIKLDVTNANIFVDSSAKAGVKYTYYVTSLGIGNKESKKSNLVTGRIDNHTSHTSQSNKARWYESYLAKLVEMGVISGYANGTLRPNRYITRGEFTKMLCVAMNWKRSKPTNIIFSDLPKNSWIYPYAKIAIGHGAIGGYQDGTFRPDTRITRGEIAKTIALALEIPIKSSDVSTLTDIKSSWAKDYINACIRTGIIRGYADDTFRPDMPATRAEAAKIIVDMIKNK